jgi:DNA-binding response OmpR family regulator
MRVLLVDAAEQMRHAIARRMRQAEIEPVGVASGAEALTLVGERFDVLVCAWASNEAIVLVRTVREVGCATPVLLYSNRVRSSAANARAIDVGADDVLLDPLDGARELIARTRALARRASGAVVRRLRVGAIVIDLATNGVRVNDQAVVLTRNERIVLLTLAAHSPRVVVIRELFRALGYAEGSQSHALKQTVVRLRHKLGAAAQQIRAIAREGYCLDARVHDALKGDSRGR